MKESALLQCLEASASSAGGNDIHATLLDWTGKEELSLRYGDLWSKAGAVAHYLRFKCELKPGECVLLIVECCLEFRVNLIGCLRAGIIVVPCEFGSKSHLLNIINCTGAKGILSDSKNSHILRTALCGNNMMVFNTTEIECNCEFRTEFIANDSPAVIQFIDGDFDQPKHIILTHANIFHNLSLAFSWTTRSMRCRMHSYRGDATGVQIVYASYHYPHCGFPLVVDFLLAFASHFHCILLSNASFSNSPNLYIEILSTFKVNVCSATYLGLQLMTKSVSSLLESTNVAVPPTIVEESDSGILNIIPVESKSRTSIHLGVDLTSLMFVLCFGESCKLETVQQFSDYFSPFGLRLDWHVQVYCVAEHTALVSYEDSPYVITGLYTDSVRCGYVKDRTNVDIRVMTHDRDALDTFLYVRHIESYPSKQDGGEKLREAPPGVEGVIWVGSDSAAECIFAPPHEYPLTSFGMHSTHAPSSAPTKRKYICTGDRGYIEADYLFICGRESDVVTVDNITIHTSVRCTQLASFNNNVVLYRTLYAKFVLLLKLFHQHIASCLLKTCQSELQVCKSRSEIFLLSCYTSIMLLAN